MSAKPERTDTTRDDCASTGTEPAAPRRSRKRLLAVLGVTGALVAAAGFVSISYLSPAGHAATNPVNCQANPGVCGFPDATNTGVPSGTTLKTVPGQISRGSGWSYNAANQEVDVTGNGAVLSGLSITGNLNITASNVTIQNDQVVTGGAYGISLRHTTGVTINNSTVSGQNLTTGRVNIAIGDLYGDSTGIVIQNNNISDFRTAVSVSTGMISGNYMHDPGYQAGDHTNGILGSGTEQLTINHNTILDSLGQTDAISVDTSTGTVVANKTIENNLLAGGSYSIYGGSSLGNSTSNIVIENNRFGQGFYAKSGQYGPAAYFDSTGSGNVWSGNTWDANGKTVTSP